MNMDYDSNQTNVAQPLSEPQPRQVFILRAWKSCKALFKCPNGEVTTNPQEAQVFDKIGSAMKAAIEGNTLFEVVPFFIG